MLLANAGLTFASSSGGLGPADGRLPWKQTAFASTSARPSSCIRRCSRRSSPASAATCREVDLVRLDPQYQLVFGGGGELMATPDVTRMERAIAALSPRDAAALRRFLADNRGQDGRFRPVLESPFLGWCDLLAAIAQAAAALAPWLSLDGELARYFRDPRIRLAFSFQSKYLGMSPFKCPSLFSILSFLEYEHGVLAPDRRLRGRHRGDGAGRRGTGRENLAGRGGGGDPVRGAASRRRARPGTEPTARRAGDQRRLRPRHDAAGARPPAPALDRSQDRRQAILVLDVHAVPRGRRPVRRPGAPHDLPGRGLRSNLDEIEDRHVLSADPSFYVQNAASPIRRWPRPAEHALRAGAGDAPAPERRLAREKARYRALALRSSRRSGSRTSSGASASSG